MPSHTEIRRAILRQIEETPLGKSIEPRLDGLTRDETYAHIAQMTDEGLVDARVVTNEGGEIIGVDVRCLTDAGRRTASGL